MISSEGLGARLQLLIAAALFSTGGAAVKAASLSGWQAACFRSAVACLVIWAVARGRRLELPRLGLRPAAVALAYALTMILFVNANKLTTAANAIFLQSTAPLYLLLLGPWLLSERIGRRDVGFMLVLAAGLALFFVGVEPTTSTATNPLLGNALGAVAGVCWAFTVVGLRWLGRAGTVGEAATFSAVLYGNLFAFAMALPFAFPVADWNPRDALVIAYLGIFQIAIAYLFLMAGLRRVPALEASLLLLLEPVLSAVWAWLVHDEVPSTWARAGGAVILLATAAKTLLDSRGRGRARGGPVAGEGVSEQGAGG